MNEYMNPYSFAHLDADEKDLARTVEYEKYLMTFVINRIRYKNIDKTTIPPFYPELVAAFRGQYGVFWDDEKTEPIIVPGAFSGSLDRYGRGKDYYGTTLDGVIWRGTVGTDCFVVPNNPLYMADAFIVSRFTYMLSQCDISLFYNLMYSRNSRFFRAETDTEKAAIEAAFNDMHAGKPVIYVTQPKKQINDVFDDNTTPLINMELTDVKDSDKLQYISRVYDDIIGRFMTMYGIDVGNVNKGSQILRGELSRLQESAAVPVYEALECRENVWSDIRKAWNTDITPVKSALYGDTPEVGTQQTDIVDPEGSDAQKQQEQQEQQEGENNDEQVN